MNGIRHVGHHHTVSYLKTRRRWVARGRQYVEDGLGDHVDCWVESEFGDEAEALAHAERADACYENYVPLSQWQELCNFIDGLNQAFERRASRERRPPRDWSRNGF